MKIFYISIFPDIFHSFVKTSLVSKAVDKNIVDFVFVNPRDFCNDKHKQIDDEIYGGGVGMLMKAEPIILSVEKIIKDFELVHKNSWRVIYLSPSPEIFDQNMAQELSNFDCVIFVCGRYEGIDFRFVEYMLQNYKDNFQVVSVWKFITLWGEIPAMLITEAIVRLIPWVIKDPISCKTESYSVDKSINNIEYPQYTRPEEVFWLRIPEILLSWNHRKIEDRKNSNEKDIS